METEIIDLLTEAKLIKEGKEYFLLKSIDTEYYAIIRIYISIMDKFLLGYGTNAIAYQSRTINR